MSDKSSVETPKINPPDGLGSKKLADAVSKVIKPDNPAPVVDHFTGKKACHRFMIPFDVQTPEPDRLDPKRVNIKVNANLAHVSCIGEKCALWNAEAKECYDVTERKSDHRIALALESIDTHSRLHTTEG